jgi:methylenetetrahydrofolate--tRNA-(uracil-5-)-methyltransferase
LQPIHIIGAGLAGCEAAFQAASAGARAVLYEMRPHKRTPAHKTDRFGELVCSNSLKSEQIHSAPWLLKQEIRRLGSLLMQAAERARVPGGHALTVDREIFCDEITRSIEAHPGIEIRRGEVTEIPRDAITVVATGPLTSDALAADVSRLTGSDRLYFYDSISPIVDADSVDTSVVFRASRYGKSLDGGDDYLNCPFTKGQYEAFLDALLAAESYEPHIEADKTPYFEGCLPIEEIARRGRDTLRFGPMKPAGLPDPRTGRWPYAVVQLRQEDVRAGSYNLVGFQNHMRFGSIHRNSYVNTPAALSPHLALRDRPTTLFAGQLTGVEGYTESSATGLLAGINLSRLLNGKEPCLPPPTTMLGALYRYLREADPRYFQPMNANFGLVDDLDAPVRDKRVKRERLAARALADLREWIAGDESASRAGAAAMSQSPA